MREKPKENRIKRLIRAFFGCFLLLGTTFAALSLPAVDLSANAPLNDGIDRTAPNFVKASLLVMGPGKALFSCADHACFRTLSAPQVKGKVA